MQTTEASQLKIYCLLPLAMQSFAPWIPQIQIEWVRERRKAAMAISVYLGTPN